jgi:pilus assembly protein CpaB
MNRRRLLTMGFVAVVLGSVVSLYLYGKLKTVAPNLPSVKVIVAARDLQVGTRIEENDVKLTEILLRNQHDFPLDSFHSKNDVLGRGVVIPIEQGDFISPKKLADRNAESGITSLITSGMRAFPLRANDVLSIGGLVAPGNRVDVLLTGNSGEGGRVAATVLQNVRVLATDQHLDRETAGKFQPSVITLLVSLEDAQKLALATTEGKIQLVLRNVSDDQQQNATPTPVETLYHTRGYSKPTIKHLVAPVPVPQMEPPSYWIIKGGEVQKKTF